MCTSDTLFPRVRLRLKLTTVLLSGGEYLLLFADVVLSGRIGYRPLRWLLKVALKSLRAPSHPSP